jgi:hypothetical protein
MYSKTLRTRCWPSTTSRIAFVFFSFCVIRKYNGGTVIPRSRVSMKYDLAGTFQTARRWNFGVIESMSLFCQSTKSSGV